MTTPQTQLRNATLEDLVEVLRGQQPRKIDVVAPATALRMEQGQLVIQGVEGQVETDSDGMPTGVTTVDGWYNPTSVALEGIGRRLGIPTDFLARAHRTNTAAADHMVNDWLTHQDYAGKHFLVRALRAEVDDQQPGVLRAFLSDSYDPSADNLDVLMAVLEGIDEAGVKTDIRSCNLTDQRMYVQFACEQVAINALPLVRGYRYGNRTGEKYPMVFAGFEVSNSEVGLGRISIAPMIIFQVCTNGQTRRVDAFERQHLGRKLEPGVIRWSDKTQKKNLELIKSKTADAVTTFLSPEYVQGVVDEMRGAAATELTEPEKTIKLVTKELRYSETQQNEILARFIRGGVTTAMGVAHAITAAAQSTADADVAAAMESDAFRALELAVKHA